MNNSSNNQNSEIDNFPQNQNKQNLHQKHLSRFSITSIASNNPINFSQRTNSSKFTNADQILNSNNSNRFCRICFESDKEHKLIIPCKCEGSIKYVHKKCIEQWIMSLNIPIDNTECEICKTKFQFKYIQPSTLTNKQYTKLIIICIVFILFISGLFTCFIFGCYFYLKINNHLKTRKSKTIYFVLVIIFAMIILSICSFLFIRFYKYKLLSKLEKKWEIIDLQENEAKTKTNPKQDLINKESDVQCITITRREKKTGTSSEIIEDTISINKNRMKKILQ